MHSRNPPHFGTNSVLISIRSLSRAMTGALIGFHSIVSSAIGCWDAVQGDLGSRLPTGPRLLPSWDGGSRSPIELLVLTVIFALGIGVPIGVLSAIRPATPADWFSRMISACSSCRSRRSTWESC